MVTEQDLAETRVSMTYELAPTRNIVGDLSGLIGEFCEDFLGAFYPRSVSRKANVVITELFANAVAHNSSDQSRIRVELRLDGEKLSVKVQNAASRERCDLVKTQVDKLRRSPDSREVLTKTIRERHANRLRGGLGLMRLVAENKCKLSARSRDGVLTVQAIFNLRGGM